MILNQAQAQAVYNAMCELNNIGEFNLFVKIGRDGATVDFQEFLGGWVKTESGEQEYFIDQAEFAAAYGLN